MPYVTEGPTGEVAQTDMMRHLFGVKGPSGFGSATTAEKVAKNWDGSGKVSQQQVERQCMQAAACLQLHFAACYSHSRCCMQHMSQPSCSWHFTALTAQCCAQQQQSWLVLHALYPCSCASTTLA
jgi:hypothetical protein